MHTKNNIHVLYASRLVEEKWVDILIECIRTYTLSHSRYNIIWHICSNGPYQDAILDLEKEYKENIIYHGFVSQNWLASLYRDADILFMPSRFLETFWLTALEALASWVPVIWLRKWWLEDFIAPIYALSPSNPVQSFWDILSKYTLPKDQKIDISKYGKNIWIQNMLSIFWDRKKVIFIHDYIDRIGGAEVYLESVTTLLSDLGYETSRFSYSGFTNIWKRRLMFLFSFIAFWRGLHLFGYLIFHRPDIVWLHSILRYIGPWWVLAVNAYSRFFVTQIYLSHHDVGLLAPFPQSVREESDIPRHPYIRDFISWLSGLKKYLATMKWFYVFLIRILLPKNTEHIIFAPFLRPHICHHFPGHTVHVLPHFYDQTIYHT